MSDSPCSLGLSRVDNTFRRGAVFAAQARGAWFAHRGRSGVCVLTTVAMLGELLTAKRVESGGILLPCEGAIRTKHRDILGVCGQRGIAAGAVTVAEDPDQIKRNMFRVCQAGGLAAAALNPGSTAVRRMWISCLRRHVLLFIKVVGIAQVRPRSEDAAGLVIVHCAGSSLVSLTDVVENERLLYHHR
jgi:hypothetical protein